MHNDEEYGKFLVTESGLFNVDELLLPHINYASFAADKKEGTLVASGYVEGGFVCLQTDRGIWSVQGRVC